MNADLVRSFLSYDKETGIFTWREIAERSPQWNAKYAGNQAGWLDDNGYIQIMINGKNYRAHRLAWLYVTGEWPLFEVDHINLCRSDNSFSNLRQATRSQNARNSPSHKDSNSRIKGVSYFKGGNRTRRWAASIMVDGKKHHIGYYLTKEEAGEAYANYSMKLHGVYGRF